MRSSAARPPSHRRGVLRRRRRCHLPARRPRGPRHRGCSRLRATGHAPHRLELRRPTGAWAHPRLARRRGARGRPRRGRLSRPASLPATHAFARPIRVHRRFHASRIYLQFAGDRGSSITWKARDDETHPETGSVETCAGDAPRPEARLCAHVQPAPPAGSFRACVVCS